MTWPVDPYMKDIGDRPFHLSEGKKGSTASWSCCPHLGWNGEDHRDQSEGAPVSAVRRQDLGKASSPGEKRESIIGIQAALRVSVLGCALAVGP